MKSKKGFTIVELLGVIIIFAVITLIAVPTFGKISKRVNERQYRNKISLIEAAALKYADDTNYVAFYVDDLITNGYLDPDEGEKVIDNRDNKTEMNCYPIIISEDAGLKYAKVEEKDKKCDVNYLASFNKYFNILANGELLTQSTWFSYEKVIVSLQTQP